MARRPTEYDNLLRIGSLKEAETNQGSIDQFMRTAQDMLADAQANARTSTKFFLAYEGMFNVVMAVLEFRGTRPGDAGGHRVTSIDIAAADVGLDGTKRGVLSRLHEQRNRVTYRRPIPPPTAADAAAMVSLLQDVLAGATALMAPHQERGGGWSTAEPGLEEGRAWPARGSTFAGMTNAAGSTFAGNDAIFEPEEVFGTKLRALLQRRKNRDLFDLHHGLQQLAMGCRIKSGMTRSMIGPHEFVEELLR